MTEKQKQGIIIKNRIDNKTRKIKRKQYTLGREKIQIPRKGERRAERNIATPKIRTEGDEGAADGKIIKLSRKKKRKDDTTEIRYITTKTTAKKNK